MICNLSIRRIFAFWWIWLTIIIIDIWICIYAMNLRSSIESDWMEVLHIIYSLTISILSMRKTQKGHFSRRILIPRNFICIISNIDDNLFVQEWRVCMTWIHAQVWNKLQKRRYQKCSYSKTRRNFYKSIVVLLFTKATLYRNILCID